MNDKADKTMNVTEENKKWIMSLKVHDRETVNDIISRLKKERQNHKLIIA